MNAAAEATPRVSRPGRLSERISLGVFCFIHVATFAAIFTGVTVRAAVIAFALYWIRMFVVTAGYHRYFAHRSFKTSRWFQFVLGLVGTTTVQKGPLWWASTHRRHHRFSDTPRDVHSPIQRGFWYAHVGWVASTDHVDTDVRSIKDFAQYPELRWLGRYHFVAPLALAVGCYLAAGWSGLIVGFAWSTVVLWHCVFTINSLAHVFGKRRFATTDTSRNNWFLAVITMGEGWHNNHHHYMNSANQGFYWWEIDVSYYILRLFSAVGLVWDLKRPPGYVLERRRIAARAEADSTLVIVPQPSSPPAAPTPA